MKYILPPGKVLVMRDVVEDDESSILIPDKVRKMPTTGKVISVGEGITFVSVDDKVVFNEYAGMVLDDGTSGLEESRLTVMELDEILAKIEE